MPALMPGGTNDPAAAMASTPASMRACIRSMSFEQEPAWAIDCDAIIAKAVNDIRRRIFIAAPSNGDSGLALLPSASGSLLSTAAQAQVTPGASPASWNDGAAKQEILDFDRWLMKR